MHSLGSEHRQERPLQPGRDSCRHGLSTGCVCWQRSVFGHLMPSSGTWVNFSWESPGWGHKKVALGKLLGVLSETALGCTGTPMPPALESSRLEGSVVASMFLKSIL